MPCEADSDINRVSTLLALAWIGAVGAAVILLLPLIVGALVTDVGLTEAQAGIVLSIDMGGYTLATIAAVLWIDRIDWRRNTLLSLLIMLVGNLLSIATQDYSTMLLIRFITGCAAGTVTATVVVAMGKTANPDRSFGLWIVCQLLLGSVGLLVLPRLISAFGIDAIFSLISLLLLSAILLIRFLPESADSATGSMRTPRATNPLAYVGALAILIAYCGLTAVWSFVERIAANTGMAPEAIGVSLSIASLAGLFGGVLALAVGTRFGRLLPITVALSSSALGIGLLMQDFGTTLYTILGCLFLFGWNLMLPYFMGSVAAVEASARSVATANAAIGIGLMAGPVVGATLIGYGGYSTMLSIGMICVALSFVLILPLALRKAVPGRE